jgi:hypothetical protein
MGRPTKLLLFGSLVAALALPWVHATGADAAEIKTSIDFGYIWSKENLDEVIAHTRELKEVYVLEYLSTVGYFYDFTAKMQFDYSITNKSHEATKQLYAPSMNMKFRSDNSELSASYDGKKDFTGTGQDVNSITAFSNSYLVETMVKPILLPQARLKWERKSGFQEQTIERVNNNISLDMNYMSGDFGANFQYAYAHTQESLPSILESRKDTWSLGMTFGRRITDAIDLQLDYDIKEDYSLDHTGESKVFSSEGQTYTQVAKASLKVALEPLTGFATSLGYDFVFDQDLLELDYRHKITNRFTAEVRKGLWRWADMTLNYEGSLDSTSAIPNEDDVAKSINKFKAGLRLKPYDWLDMESKAEKEYTAEIKSGTGASTERGENGRIDNSILLNWSTALRGTIQQGIEQKKEEGLVKTESVKYRFKLEYRPSEYLSISPAYTNGLTTGYDVSRHFSNFDSQTRDWDAQLQISFSYPLMNYAEFRAEQSWDYKEKQELDKYLDLTETADFTEDTRLTLSIQNIIAGVQLRFEATRKATDSRDDEEPMIVDRSLGIALDWVIGEIALGGSWKFDEKGAADDSLSINAKVSWKREYFEVAGEYQYDKVFSTETNVKNTYNLKARVMF